MKLKVDFEKIRSFFRRGTFVPFITDKEIMAIPFYADNVEGLRGHIGTEAPWPHIPDVAMDMSFSYCPGDFENTHTPSGEPELHNPGSLRYQTLFADNPIREALNSRYAKPYLAYFLEPGGRYFLNLRIRQDEVSDTGQCMERIGPDSWTINNSNMSYESVKKRTVKGERLPLCGTLMGHYGDMHRYSAKAPYTGPHLGLDGPYPINYEGDLVPSRVHNEREASRGCKQVDDHVETWECYDPEDNLPPQKFSRACVNGEMEWVEGKGQPAYPQYRCEKLVDGESAYENSGHSLARAHYIPCAAHRDGQTRILTCRQGSSSSTYRRTEQCQFDNDRGRYDWAMTKVSNPGHQMGSSGLDCSFTYNTNNPPPHKQNCTFAGREFAIGTTIKASCEVQGRSSDCDKEGVECRTNQYGTRNVWDSATFTCKQRADAPALPRFVRQSGYLDRVPAFSPNCEIEEL